LRAIFVASLILILAKLMAGPLDLAFPLDCKLGETCFIQQYVDADPSDGVQDFTCGTLSYGGHKGTDIRLAHVREIKGVGVEVRASAAGIIRGTRNNMIDIAQGATDAPDISGRECGNGVVIDHGEGWQTQYCHMREGSVAVSKGQVVQQGDALGLVGLSGKTEFPHLHIKVSKDGQTVDPFNADAVTTCGPNGKTQLWQSEIVYQPGGFLSAGFASSAPSFSEIKQGLRIVSTLPRDAPAVIVWGFLFGVQKGDQLEIEIQRPDGTPLFQHTKRFERNFAQAFRLGGKRLTKATWPTGTYQAFLTLTRVGTVISASSQSIQVD
jgi:hypothetical protein